MSRGSALTHRGFTFVAVLVLIALTSLGLAIAGPIWAQQVQREREAELLRVGVLYVNAIASYRSNAPGSLQQYPKDVTDLLLDKRFVGVKRHLREAYGDPVSPGQGWELIRNIDERIVGVRSRSSQTPLIRRPLDLGAVALPVADRYFDWKFVVKDAS